MSFADHLPSYLLSVPLVRECRNIAVARQLANRAAGIREQKRQDNRNPIDISFQGVLAEKAYVKMFDLEDPTFDTSLNSYRTDRGDAVHHSLRIDCKAVLVYHESYGVRVLHESPRIDGYCLLHLCHPDQSKLSEAELSKILRGSYQEVRVVLLGYMSKRQLFDTPRFAQHHKSSGKPHRQTALSDLHPTLADAFQLPKEIADADRRHVLDCLARRPVVGGQEVPWFTGDREYLLTREEYEHDQWCV